jgi:pimeloyl-ACP methyl ester carboxylesterase
MEKTENLVLLRGLIRSRYHWGPFPEYVKETLGLKKVDTPELRGNGFRSKEETPEKIEEAIEDLRSQVKIESPIALVGVSLGGMLATRWAQMYPQEISSLTVINTSSSLSPFYHRLRPENYAGILKNLSLGSAAANERFIMNATSNKKEKWLPVLKDYTEFLEKNPVQIKNFLRQLNLSSQIDFKNIPRTKKMILVSSNDRLVSPQCSEDIANVWKCEIRRHPEAGHDLPLDDAAWTAEQLKSLL